MASDPPSATSIQDLFLHFQAIAQKSLTTQDYNKIKPFMDALQKEIFSPSNGINKEKVFVLSNQLEDLLEALVFINNGD